MPAGIGARLNASEAERESGVPERVAQRRSIEAQSAIVAAIIHHNWLELNIGAFTLDVEIIARTAMWFMVAISLISAFDYFFAFWKKIEA